VELGADLPRVGQASRVAVREAVLGSPRKHLA
jgi:hypothetical protein